MKIKSTILVALFASLAASPAWSINKCAGPGGNTVFQDTPCADGQGEKVEVRPSSSFSSGVSASGQASAATQAARKEIADTNRRFEVTSAIERGEPLVGMTSAELERALGQPDRINAGTYGGVQKDQLIYERNGRTWYVYTRNGMVESIQNTESVAGGGNRQKRSCPSAHEIRNAETSASSITLGDAERAERYRQIAVMRACR